MTGAQTSQDLREAMVRCLVEGVEDGIEIVVLVSDSSSTSSIAPFAARFPKRLVNVGIAEQNLLGVAAGLSRGGYVSVTANAACFLVARSCEQLKTDICYSASNVKLMGLNAGVAYGPLASTHHAIDDISILRGFGTIRIYAPADGVEASQVIAHALRSEGPVYVRLDNVRLPVFHDEGYRFQSGRIDVPREGGDLTIFALGSVVHEALEAGDTLAKQGVHATVANVSSVRPTDAAEICRRARATGHVVTVEEHSVNGGLGSLVAESLVEGRCAASFVRLGIPDGQFAKAGPRAEIRRYYGIDAAGIVQASRRLLAGDS